MTAQKKPALPPPPAWHRGHLSREGRRKEAPRGYARPAACPRARWWGGYRHS